MKRTKTAPRISNEAAEFLPTVFPSVNAGCEFVLDAFPVIFQRTIHDIKATFTEVELKLLIDLHNGHMMSAGHVGQGVTFSISDGIKYDALDEKWGVDPQEIIAKAKRLSHFEKAAIEMWATAFWYSQKSVNTGGQAHDLHAYIK